MRVDSCLICGCPCAVDASGNTSVAVSLRSSCQHGMCGCHQLAEAHASTSARPISAPLPMRSSSLRVSRRRLV